VFNGSGRSIQLARIAGIRIGATPSWFLMLFGSIYLLTGYFGDVVTGSDGTEFTLAVIASLLFFGSIVLHELGHAIVARRNGIAIEGIDLFFLGGVARLAASRDIETPGREFRVAAAGPAVTVAVIALCLGGSAIASHWSGVVDSATFSEGTRVTATEALLGWLAAINVWLLCINILPALPLDGGRIARAIAWRVTGDRVRATRLAARAGQGLGYVLMGIGFLVVLSGTLPFVGGADQFTGVWFVVIGLFVGQAARAEMLGTVFSERIQGLTVADVMDREPVWMPAESTALQAHDEFVLRYRYPWFPVVDSVGRYAGVLRSEQIEDAIADGRPASTVTELIDPATSRFGIGTDRPLEALLREPALQELGALIALDGDGLMAGVVTLDQVRRALLNPSASA
jgi:Zn-dependent protease